MLHNHGNWQGNKMGEKLSLVVADVIYGKSPDHDIPENQTIDFQDGYAIGMATDDALNEITLEYQRRGFVMDASFQEWKRGMWAGAWARVDVSVE